jgi:hypothetical protein
VGRRVRRIQTASKACGARSSSTAAMAAAVRLGVHARGKRRGIFYSRREAVGTLLACQGKWSLGKDRSMAEVRRGVGGGVRRY